MWTPSEFISQNLRKYTDKPVYTLPYSVTAPADAAYDRDYFHLPKDRFLFLMMYDSGSGMVRKNPLGAIEAFKQAFDRGNKQVGLVIKMNRSEQSEKDIENIRTKLGRGDAAWHDGHCNKLVCQYGIYEPGIRLYGRLQKNGNRTGYPAV